MKQYEYQTIQLKEGLIQTLDKLGQEGFELVSMEDFTAIFRREKITPAKYEYKVLELDDTIGFSETDYSELFHKENLDGFVLCTVNRTLAIFRKKVSFGFGKFSVER